MDFEHLIDLAAERLGGAAVATSDDFFAPKENLVKPGRGEFVPGKYTDVGKWMDGWESRRRRDGGHDWCVVRLGLEGAIHGIDVDTNHFIGNAPKAVRLEGLRVAGYRPTHALLGPEVSWTELLPMTEVKPGSQNLIPVASREAFTHVRLHIHPDGGVARLRVYGEVRPDWGRILDEQRVVDLAAVEHGARVIDASDHFFSDKRNLILPGPSTHMGDGWETRRRRGPGHDWIVVALGRPGALRRAVIDTMHYKGNFPESCMLEGASLPQGTSPPELASAAWRPLLARTPLEAHTAHRFALEQAGVVSHVRLSIYPDGGIARLRLFGVPEGAA